MLDSDEWERIAITAIARARARHRRGLALWTAALSATGELADVLVRLARLNESGDTVETWLRLRRGWSGWDIDPAYNDDDVVHAWFALLAEMLSVREDLWRISFGGQDDVWRWFRAPLPPRMQAELERRALSAQTDSERRAILARATSTPTLTHPRSLLWR